MPGENYPERQKSETKAGGTAGAGYGEIRGEDGPVDARAGEPRPSEEAEKRCHEVGGTCAGSPTAAAAITIDDAIVHSAAESEPTGSTAESRTTIDDANVHSAAESEPTDF
jgi:hypothetical protein